MLEDGIIEKSTSEWASPLVIVRKPSGNLRIYVDYRRLNEATRVASYPLPNMTETLERLADAKFSTTIDIVSGYHQIELAPQDRYKTGFVSPFGLFQYCRLPFGLAGAPGTFQAVIEDMLQVLERLLQVLRGYCKLSGNLGLSYLERSASLPQGLSSSFVMVLTKMVFGHNQRSWI